MRRAGDILLAVTLILFFFAFFYWSLLEAADAF